MTRPSWRVAALVLISAAAARAAGPGRNAAGPVPDARFALGGPVGEMLDRVTRNWLLPAPAANPAMLAMFRDRDRPPYRNLLPWSGEFAGKYLTGATEILRLTGDTELRQHLARFVAEFVACQDADGYLGPFPKGHRLTGEAPNVDGKPGGTWDAWGHYHALLGLLRWAELTDDPAALAAATRIGDLLCDRFLGDKRPRLVDTGWTEMNMAPAHGLLLLHRRTGVERYRDLAGQLIAEFAALDPKGAPLAGDYLRRGLAGEPFFRTPKPRWESLHPLMALPEWHRTTGDPAHRAAFENLWWSIAELDRHNNGGFSSGEQAQGNPYHRGAIETCCTVAWLATGVELLGLTADPVVADELELATLNSALGWFAPNGRWCTYDTPMDGVRKAAIHDIGFQCRPGSPELSCCSANAPRGLGLVADWAVRRDAAGLLLNWYGPGSIDAPLDSGLRIKLTQETDYPAGNKVALRVDLERPQSFNLRLRIPHWSTRTTARLNGEPIPDVAPGRYLALEREWHPGDRVDLEFDFAPRVWAGERECAGRASIYRGPLLLAYDRRFNPDDAPEVPALDAATLAFRPIAAPTVAAPIVLVEVATRGGPPAHLCDFARAGADGSGYRTWLDVAGVAPTPFRRSAPSRTGPAAASGTTAAPR